MRVGWSKVRSPTCWFGFQRLLTPGEGALDSGAHGIIVPLIYTAEDVMKLLNAAKFPPQGQRGFGSPFPMERFGGQTSTEYLQQANESLLTIVQIETKEALHNVSSTHPCIK